MELSKFQSGLDDISLLGSFIASNDKFLFVSANGHNVYNGMVVVFHKNPELKNDKLTFKLHSNIYSPETLNANFGLKLGVTNSYLVVNAISYDIYQGAIFIYKYIDDYWIYTKKITIRSNNFLNGFGCEIYLNNNKLYALTFFGKIHIFNIDETNKSKQIQVFDNKFNTYAKFVGDIYGNTFFSNLTNTITILNYNHSLSYFSETSFSNDCFFGSNLFLTNNKIYVSCSAYYPFYNNNFESFQMFFPKVYVYDILYDNSNIPYFLELQNILNDDYFDNFFGTSVFEVDKHLIIAGNSCIYQYYDQKFISNINVPKSRYNYDYTLHISSSNIIVGNYMDDDLRGAVFVGNIKDITGETSIDNISKIDKSNSNSIVFFVLLLLFGILMLLIVMMTFYYCVLCFTPIPEKKKKKEEEESPYKVYSYIGYVETDDFPVAYPPHVNYQQPQMYYWNYYPNQNYLNYQNYNLKDDKKLKTQQLNSEEKIVTYKQNDKDSNEIVVTYKS